MICIILGPFAPTYPSSKAPPIHNANGPNIAIKPSRKKFEIIPSSLPFISIQASITANIPNKKASQCNHLFGSCFAVVRLTPSSISNSMNFLVLLRPNINASPSVVTAVKIVAPIPRVGFTSKSPVLNSMKPTADNTTGTAARASR